MTSLSAPTSGSLHSGKIVPILTLRAGKGDFRFEISRSVGGN